MVGMVLASDRVGSNKWPRRCWNFAAVAPREARKMRILLWSPAKRAGFVL